MSPTRCLSATLVGALVAGGACQEREATPTAANANAVEIRTTDGRVTGHVVAGTPCSAIFGDAELAVTDRKADVAGVAWTVVDGNNGADVLRDGVEVARAFARTADQLAVMDANGVALFRANVTGTTAIIASSSGQKVRALSADAREVSVTDADGQPLARVTGTTDLALAAIVTAPELAPEVRALLACHHLQPSALPAPSTSPSPSTRPTP